MSIQKMCVGKISYSSFFKASFEAGRSKTKYGKSFRVYQCPFCNNFHLTTQDRRWYPISVEKDARNFV